MSCPFSPSSFVCVPEIEFGHPLCCDAPALVIHSKPPYLLSHLLCPNLTGFKCIKCIHICVTVTANHLQNTSSSRKCSCTPRPYPCSLRRLPENRVAESSSCLLCAFMMLRRAVFFRSFCALHYCLDYKWKQNML